MDYNTTFLNIVQAMFISHAYFFVPPIIVTFQSTMPGFRWHDYSRFREIIILIFIIPISLTTHIHAPFLFISAIILYVSKWKNM